MRTFRFQSIQSHIAAAFAVLILFTSVVVSVSAYQLSDAAARNTAQDYTAELIKQLNLNIETYVSNMETMSSVVLNNRRVKEYFALQDGSNAEDVAEFLQSVSMSRKDISSIVLFDAAGHWVSNRPGARLNPNVDVASLAWYREAIASDGDIVISSSHVQPIFRDDYRWVVSLSREIRFPGGGETAGVLLVDLNFSVLNDMFAQIDLGKRGYVFIVDDRGNLVYHPQQQLIYSRLKSERIDDVLRNGDGSFIASDGNQSRMYTVQNTGFGWNIVGVSYLDELVANKGEMRLSFLVLGLAGLLLALAASFVLSRKLSRPIQELQEYMKEVEKGNFDIQVPVDGTREIGRLARTFNLMVQQIKALMSQVVREQEFKRKSELSALQSQINPHFLYNTLDSIIWMAEAKKSEEVVLMTSALARLFRASIGKGRETVPVRTEVEHITNYLTIQQMRYRDKLNFRIDVSQDVLHCRTLKILLQPLVENAIYHGIKHKPGPGLVVVEGEAIGDDLVFRVADDGVGMERDKLRTILDKADGDDRKGVGVANVHERIQLYFGSRYGLRYDSEPDRGTTVTVTLPRIESDEDGGRAS